MKITDQWIINAIFIRTALQIVAIVLTIAAAGASYYNSVAATRVQDQTAEAVAAVKTFCNYKMVTVEEETK